MSKALTIALALTTVASLAGNVFLYNRYSTGRPVMRIGSEAISKKEYFDTLEYRSGKEVLQELAFNRIIGQAAQKAGVKVTPAQVDDRLKEIERRTPEALLQAKASPENMEAYRKMLTSKLMVEELSMRGVKVSDAELTAFYKRNAAAFLLPIQAQATVVVAKNTMDAATAKALFQKNMPPAIIAEQPRLIVVGDTRYNRDWRQLPAGAGALLNKAMYGKKQGDIVVVQAGALYFVAHITKMSGGGVPPLEQNKALATRIARMSKAPKEAETLARLYRDANVRFEVSRYAGYFADVEKLAKQGEKKVATNR